MAIFLLDFGAERYVEIKYGVQSDADIQEAVTGQGDRRASATSIVDGRMEHEDRSVGLDARRPSKAVTFEQKFAEDFSDEDVTARERSFRQQIAAFLILEFGVIFHSVIIGLNLGVVGSEFSTLYPVLVFHQSFEGLGIGARMSTIPFKPHSWLPWLLCSAYGLTVSSSYDI